MGLKTKNYLDLEKIKDIAFKNIEMLLQSLNIEYSIHNDIYYSTCPIHTGSDNKKAFSISEKSKLWKCWTRDCELQYNRDIFGLVRGVLSSRSNKEISFMDSVKYVCKIYNIKTQENLKVVDVDELIENDLSKIVKIFDKQKVQKDEPKVDSIKISDTSEYFMNRGFLKSTLKHFGVGDCIDNTHQMKNRAIIPIHNEDNDVVGYIGRSTKDYITPKFLFSKGFKKADYLYNYNSAKQHIFKTSSLFLVEGQGDVWRLFECGVHNCVGIFGKEISERQKDLLINSGATTLVVLTDDDQAGRHSKFQIQRQLSRLFTLKFPDIDKKDIGDMSVENIEKNILSNLKGLY